jgi:FecR protein
MGYRSSTEGGYGIGASTDHVDASHTDRIDVPDAELLFRGHFARSGPDLILTGQDGHRLVVTGYFTTEKHPDLVAPNGAHLTGDLVDLLAGSPTPGQYAQAKTTLPPDAIGKVEKVVGQVMLIHNGVAGPLHVGDAVYKTDIVETAANSSCGIAFPDGTALDLVNNTRMALNEYNYEANSASNGALFSLVEGTFAFVAGQVAHTGEGLKINTPVATMGVRGTVGLFRTEPTIINSNLGHVWSVFLHEDIDGSHHLGRIALIDQDPTSPTFGQTFYLLDSSDYIAYLEPQGGGQPPHVRLEPITNSRIFENRHFFNDLGKIIESYNNADPQSPSTPGSGDNPSDLFQQQLFQDDGGKPLFNFAKLGSGDQDNIFSSSLPLTPVMGGLLPNTNITTSITTSNEPTPLASTIFIWNGTGAWPTALANWNSGAAPNSPIDSVIIQTGTATFNLPNTTISFLTIDPGATLDVVGGQLNTAGLIDNGTINVDGDPPALVVTGPASIGSGGTLTAQDGSATFTSGSLLNAGALTADRGGSVLINESGINSAIIRAIDGGLVTIENGTIVNSVSDSHGNITDGKVFVGDRSQLVLDNASIMQGIVHVGCGGEIETISGTNNTINTANGPTHNTTVPSLIIDEGGSVVVNDNSSLVLASPYNIENNGTIELKSTGHATILYFSQPNAVLAGDGNIVLDGSSGSQDIIAGLPGQGFATNLDNQGNTIEGAGAIGQNDHALSVTNDGCSVIDANLNGQTLFIETGNTFTNNALMEATNGGILDVLDHVAGKGSVAISGGGIAVFAGAFSQDVAFSGAGTLELAYSLRGAYCGTITGFGAGDTLILADLAFSQCEYAVWCNNILTIYDGETTETIKLVGNYSKNSFAIVDDGGKTEVVFVGDEWIGPSSGDRTGTWTTGADWNLGVPTSKLNAIVDLPGAYTITTSSDQVANSLAITDTDATLTGCGSLTLGTLENHGTIKTTDEHTLVINIKNGGTNSGTIKADGGTIAIYSSYVDNKDGLITALGCAAAIVLADTTVAGGTIEARHDGVVDLDHAPIIGSTIETSCGGFVQTVCGNSTLQDATIACGSDVLVNCGTSLTLVGGIHDWGAIVVGPPQFEGDPDLIIKGDVTLDGSGSVVLNGANDSIVAAYEGGKLTNDSNIVGAGHVGNGDGNLWLFNENCGTIDANSCQQALTLDTGCNPITNAGTLAADNGGRLDVESSVINNTGGSIKVSDGGFADFEKSVTGGTAVIQGGTLKFDAASSVDVTFDNNGGHYGELILGDVKGFSGTIFGFNGQGSECPTLLTSDEIDLRCVRQGNVCFSEGADGDAIITVKDARTVLATITIDNFDFRNLEKASDGQGGTIIFDPPASANANPPSVSIGGAGNDTFVFHPGEGSQTVNSFDPQHDTIELDQFANIHNVQELAAAITPDMHGNAVLELGHGDSIAIPGVSATCLQQNLQSLVHLHA